MPDKVYEIGAQMWHKLEAGETVALAPGVGVRYATRFCALKQAAAIAYERGDIKEAHRLADEMFRRPHLHQTTGLFKPRSELEPV